MKKIITNLFLILALFSCSKKEEITKKEIVNSGSQILQTGSLVESGVLSSSGVVNKNIGEYKKSVLDLIECEVIEEQKDRKLKLYLNCIEQKDKEILSLDITDYKDGSNISFKNFKMFDVYNFFFTINYDDGITKRLETYVYNMSFDKPYKVGSYDFIDDIVSSKSNFGFTVNNFFYQCLFDGKTYNIIINNEKLEKVNEFFAEKHYPSGVYDNLISECYYNEKDNVLKYTLNGKGNNYYFSYNEPEDIINNYYESIKNQNFEKAISLLYDSNTSIDSLKKLYTLNGKNYYISVNDIKHLGNNKYNYKVDIYYKDKFLEESFDITKEIIGGKLKDISVKEIKKVKVKEEIKYGNMKAYVENVDGIEAVFLEKYGKKILVRKIVDKIEDLKNSETGEFDIMSYILSIGDLEFLGNGKVLKFITSGWEFSSDSFYIVDKNIILGGNGITSLYGFTKDKRYFYLCGLAGMSGNEEFKIYDTKTWQISDDLGEKLIKDGNIINSCEKYEEKNNNLIYTVYNNKTGDSDIKYIYNFGTNKITKK